MATRKKNGTGLDGAGSILSTISGPSDPKPPSSMGTGNPVAERLRKKVVGNQQLSAEMPFNPLKPLEYGEAARTPHPGPVRTPPTALATGSTSTEHIASPKVGDGMPPARQQPHRRRRSTACASTTPGSRLTTNQGVPVADNQHSLKIGLRGPTAMEDFILREKITHFDHERIPERVVHARGSAAHGYFECYGDLSGITRAAPFAADRQAHPGVRALFHRGRRTRFDRHRRATCAASPSSSIPTKATGTWSAITSRCSSSRTR